MTLFHLLKTVTVLFPSHTLLLHSTKTVCTHTLIHTSCNQSQSSTVKFSFYWTQTPLGLTLLWRRKRSTPSTLLHHITSQRWKRNVPSTLTHHLYKQKKQSNYINHLSQRHPPITQKQKEGVQGAVASCIHRKSAWSTSSIWKTMLER